jgi:hypothetical protein
MKRTILTLPLLIVLGCATFSQNARKTIYGADQLADAAMKGWAVYYHDATNNPAKYHETLVDVEGQHIQVNLTSKSVGASLSTAHTMIDAYQAGLATKSQLQSAVDAALQSAPQLVRMVAEFTGNTNLLANIPKTAKLKHVK